MRYYRSLSENFFAIFDFFDNFLINLKKLAQTSYTQFLNNAKLQNNKSNNEILLERITGMHSFYIKNKKTASFRIKLAIFVSYFL